MKYYFYLIISIFLFFSACSGVDSRVNKSFKNTENTIALKDLTARDHEMMDAGSQLEDALEDTIARSVFIITHENPKYILKYKVLNYRKGSAFSKSTMEVKAALYDEGDMVGAWTVDAWVRGVKARLFQKAADEIMRHLRGDGDF
jgi:hypothetical protein